VLVTLYSADRCVGVTCQQKECYKPRMCNAASGLCSSWQPLQAGTRCKVGKCDGFGKCKVPVVVPGECRRWATVPFGLPARTAVSHASQIATIARRTALSKLWGCTLAPCNTAIRCRPWGPDSMLFVVAYLQRAPLSNVKHARSAHLLGHVSRLSKPRVSPVLQRVC
jgi:hypothetical protein